MTPSHTKGGGVEGLVGGWPNKALLHLLYYTLLSQISPQHSPPPPSRHRPIPARPTTTCRTSLAARSRR